MKTQWIGGGCRRISRFRLDILSKMGVWVYLNTDTGLEVHLGEGVPSQRTVVFNQIFCCCNSPHDDELCTFFAYLSFTGTNGKHVTLSVGGYI